MEEEKVGGREHIQNKSVSTAGKSVRPKLMVSTAGRKSVFVVCPTNRTNVAHGFLGGSGSRALAQTPPRHQKGIGVCRHSPKNGASGTRR